MPGGLECHTAELKQKTRATQGCSGLKCLI
jgi:hypothetical protein